MEKWPVLVLLFAALLAAGCGNRPPRTPGPPSGTLYGYPGDSAAFVAVTTDPENDAVWYRFAWGDGETLGWVGPTASGQSLKARHAWDTVGGYLIRVQARDLTDARSGWSRPHDIEICRLPVPAHITGGPSGGIALQEYSFCATAPIPAGESLRIEFDWDDRTTTFSSVLRTGDSARVTHAWPRDSARTCSVRVRSVTVFGRPTSWSDPWPFVLLPSAPPLRPDRPSGPTQGHGGSYLTFSTAATDTAGESLHYRFDWGNGDTSGWTEELVPSGTADSLTYTWKQAGTFQVRAQARDHWGAWSEWSEPLVVTLDSIGTRIWSVDIGLALGCPAVDADGSIYLVVTDDKLVKVSPSGTILWQVNLGARARESLGQSPTIGPDGNVYVSTVDSCLLAFHPDGGLAWRYVSGGSYVSSPAIAADGAIVFGCEDGNVYALEPDGTLRWTYPTGQKIGSCLVIAVDGTVYASSDSLHAINRDGTRRWVLAHRIDSGTAPALDEDGTIYFGDGHLLVASSPEGDTLWTARLGQDLAGSPIIAHDRTLYAVGFDCVAAFAPSGARIWKLWIEDAERCSAPVVCDDGTLLVFDGVRLNAFTPDGTIEWRCEAYWTETPPTVAPDGTIYLASYDLFHAIRGTSGLASSPWPKFQRDLGNTGRAR